MAQAECVQHGVRTIAFCKTRKLCELVITYAREMLRASAPHLCHAISVYRAGYSPTVSPPTFQIAVNLGGHGRGDASSAAHLKCWLTLSTLCQERREIEKALFSGTLHAVAATNALELGLDVGSLDMTMHLGFQGTS